MATMVKEKRREKKKSKDKHVPRSSKQSDELSNLEENIEQDTPTTKVAEHIQEAELLHNESVYNVLTPCSVTSSPDLVSKVSGPTIEKDLTLTEAKSSEPIVIATKNIDRSITQAHTESKTLPQSEDKSREATQSTESVTNQVETVRDSYQELNDRLERITIPNLNQNLDIRHIEERLANPEAYIRQTGESVKLLKGETVSHSAMHKSEIDTEIPKEVIEDSHILSDKDASEQAIETDIPQEVISPSAPMLEEEPMCSEVRQQQEEIQFVRVKAECMPLEEAVRLYGGAEMAEVVAISEREEAIVETGPLSGPEHPLVDLLSTFRSSLKAVERERTQLDSGLIEEEISRNALWRVEKKSVNVSAACPCGQVVKRKFVYEVAELQQARLPMAKMKLEGLLRDVQESYCHHQHAALLAHCQIEELIAETTQSNKNEIREALALVLQALRLADDAAGAGVLPAALCRWAGGLSAALLRGGDLRQTVHLIHHLFRQTRSVSWASRVLRIRAGDRRSTATAIALLELLLARPRLEAAVECTEDTEDGWEEVDKRGSGSGVSEGALRERDLLALLRAFPLRDLVARIVLFTHADIRNARPSDWSDSSGGAGVRLASCGVRSLLRVLRLASLAHGSYTRLRKRLREIAANALHALAALHCNTEYSPGMKNKVYPELEACFAAGVELCDSQQIQALPAALLAKHSAREYCMALIMGLHDKTPRRLDSPPIEIPVMSCDNRVRIVAQAALDRRLDHELARTVLDFLFQTGIKRKAVQCKGSCDVTARQELPRLLAVHPYLHTMAFDLLADIHQVEPVDATTIKSLSTERWRPNSVEVYAVLTDWGLRCPQLIQHLLLQMDYNPFSGLSLETQLTIGSWLCHYQKSLQPTPEWMWQVLRRLQVHRTCWNMSLDAPPPDPEPSDLFTTAYALLASSWGHCVPLICDAGVSALLQLASSRPHDAVRCLAPIMLVMAHAPDSVSYTPKFSEVLSTLLNSGPSMVARALGRGDGGAERRLLALLLAQLDACPAGFPRAGVVSAWQRLCWPVPLSAAARLLDSALLSCREWTHFDAFANQLMEQENAKEHISNAVRHAASAPLVTECVLRAAHAQREARTHLSARLYDALHRQRLANERIHVDNALKSLGVNMTAEDLIIHRTATAALVAPPSHPAHLPLWRLLMHLFLQRPPNSMLPTTPPVGPLFFSGLIKSRTLLQIKKRLLETITYHTNEAEILKQELHEENRHTSEPVVTTSERTIKTKDGFLPSMTIQDLTGESSDSDDSSESEEDSNVQEVTEDGVRKRDAYNLMCYHIAADKMIREYIRWLDEGDKTRAMPHHADIARFINEQALDAAWKHELTRRRAPAQDEPLSPTGHPPLPPSTPFQPPMTPFEAAIATLMRIKDQSSYSVRRPSLKTPLDDVNIKDARALLTLVKKHLADIEVLAQEWGKEVSRVATLDSALWQLVSSLRVARPVPVIKQQCAKKCAPVKLVVEDQEWCISRGAERGIQENRCAAYAGLRRLARPRPHAAFCAAALHAIARRVSSSETARRACDCAWQSAKRVAHCTPAQAALDAFVTCLAERWLCHDAAACSELISRWASDETSQLQQSLIGALVCPRRLPTKDWPVLYTALLKARLPEHAAFSYLSKFEMGWWASQNPSSRREVLQALMNAAQRFGCAPDTQQLVLLELLGVHTTYVVSPPELCWCVRECAAASAQARMPPAYWSHVARAAEATANHVPFDQLGHLLRELGVIWWEARTKLKTTQSQKLSFEMYALSFAELLRVLQRAFVAAAVKLSYSPERVALYAWSSLQESWSPWVRPLSTAPPLLPATVEVALYGWSSLQESWSPWVRPLSTAPPLLPATGEGDEEQYTPMLRHFDDALHQLMLDCPGTEQRLLQQVFEWTIQTYLGATSGVSTSVSTGASVVSQESGVQLSALLVELRGLPWTEHQWMCESSLQVALQIASSSDKEITSWCAAAWKGTSAGAWLCDVTDETLAPRLAALLYLFTAMTHSPQTLEEATYLPWWRLPSAALEEAAERFFAQYHNPNIPYHEVLQFRVLLYASELTLRPEAPPPQPCSAPSRQKRLSFVSLWLRAASAPPLLAHVGGHCRALLNALTDLAPHVAESEGELEELVGRAVIVMGLEPAAAAALPKWQEWVTSTSAPMVKACLSAAALLTTYEYFAALGDSAVKAHLLQKESSGWAEIITRWHQCHWTEACPLAARGRLHAAYAVLRAHLHAGDAIRTTLMALVAADIDFVEEEVILAVWICAACRIAREDSEVSNAGRIAGLEIASVSDEVASAARALLSHWAVEARRSLLRVVAMQADPKAPTPRIRVLSRLALCILEPSEATAKAYEAACAAVQGSADVAAWGRSPAPKRLPRLAVRLFPNKEAYFRDELDFAPETV